ncbi:MAG: hypothetical protein N3F67_02150 [Acidilobaceae archaeon]|nr:hypothetical protein [Acidilobaceae archaeon]
MKHKCLACGRPFPQGQGIVISRGGLELRFHSSKCAAKFFRAFFERANSPCLEEMARLARDMERSLEERAAKKRI